MTQDRDKEIVEVLKKYQKDFVELGRTSDAMACFTMVNWKKMQRAETAQEAEEIAKRVLDPKRRVVIDGNVVSS